MKSWFCSSWMWLSKELIFVFKDVISRALITRNKVFTGCKLRIDSFTECWSLSICWRNLFLTFGVIWVDFRHSGSNGVILDHWGPYAIFWDHLGHYGVIKGQFFWKHSWRGVWPYVLIIVSRAVLLTGSSSLSISRPK